LLQHILKHLTEGAGKHNDHKMTAVAKFILYYMQ